MSKRPILTVRKTVTVKPEFLDYLDQVAMGETIRFDNEEDELEWLSHPDRVWNEDEGPGE